MPSGGAGRRRPAQVTVANAAAAKGQRLKRRRCRGYRHDRWAVVTTVEGPAPLTTAGGGSSPAVAGSVADAAPKHGAADTVTGTYGFEASRTIDDAGLFAYVRGLLAAAEASVGYYGGRTRWRVDTAAQSATIGPFELRRRLDQADK